jgi:glycine hydroxymethyltransferase
MASRKVVLCGYSSYPRDYDYAAFKKVADEAGALTMADISHIGGPGGGARHAKPVRFRFRCRHHHDPQDVRGPRGGLILSKAAYAKKIDSSVFPGLQGGPHMNVIAGAAITFKKAAEPQFVE